MDPVVDEQLALFVVNSHIRSHPDMKNGVIEEEKEIVKDGLARDLGIQFIYFVFLAVCVLYVCTCRCVLVSDFLLTFTFSLCLL